MLGNFCLLFLFIGVVTSHELCDTTTSGWVNTDCNFTLTKDEGKIISPVTKADTKRDFFCRWKITSPKNTHISVQFTSFNVAYEESCRWGYVEIYFGNNTNDEKVDGKKLCGNVSNSQSWTFQANSIVVFYYGNAQKLYQGFTLKWASSEVNPVDEFNKCGEQNTLPEFASKFLKSLSGSLSDEEYLFTNASEGSWPWHAILNVEDESYLQLCQATILSRKIGITAAHCVESFISGNRLNTDLFVFVGKHLASVWEATEQNIRIVGVHIHEDRLISKYLSISNEIYDNDLALLELEASMEYSPYVRPVCFPQPGEHGNLCIATGWNIQYTVNTLGGMILKHGNTDGLKELEIEFYEDHVCDLLLAQEKFIHSEFHNFLCGTTGSLKSPTRTTLEGGDSGGPLVCFQNDHWELVGVSVAILQYGSIGKIVHLFMKVDNAWVRQKLGIQRRHLDANVFWN